MTFLQKVKAKLFGDLEKAFVEVEAEEPLDLSSAVTPNTTVLPAAVPQGEPVGAPPSLATNAHQTNCACPSCEQHVNQEVHMDKKELVSNVLRVQKRPESERALYEALPEEVLQSLLKANVEQPQTPAVPVPAFTTEQLQAALQAVLPRPDADVMFVQNQHKAQSDQLRKEWSTFIAANSAYTAEECTVKTLSDLQKLYQTIQASAQQGNYGGRAFPSMTANVNEDTVPDPPAIMLAPVSH